MRILLVTMKMDIGGAETHILELAKELKRRGNEVFVASNGGTYVKELNDYGIEHISAPLHNKNFINMIKSYRILRKIIKEKSIDLVHSHTRISSFICGKLQKRMGFPFVTSAHWTFKVTPLLKKMTNWGENVIAVSNDIKEYLIKNYGVKAENIIVTVNGIDTEKFSKDIKYEEILEEFKLNINTRKIVYISRLDDSRALVARQLIEISTDLNSNIENLEIIIVGGGDVFEELKTKADKVNESIGRKVITMTGARSDINKFAAMGEIFIGVSRSALEAMACERPVIVAGNEGYLGIFDENKVDTAIETNFCCRGLQLSNPDLLKGDILKLMSESPETKQKLGEFGRKVVKERYSVGKMTDDCQVMYEKTLGQNR